MYKQKFDNYPTFKTQTTSAYPQNVRWGVPTIQQQEQPTQTSSLLSKKDLQIKRLQSQLENQKKRAESALKMLDSFRNSYKIQEETSANAKSEVSRRLKAQQQARKLRVQNEKLKALLVHQMSMFETFKKDMQGIAEK